MLTSKIACKFESAGLALRVFADLNIQYLHEMLGRGDILMSVWSLRSFHNKNYVKFMNSVADSLDKSFKTHVPIPSLDRKVAEKVSLHVVNQLRFPLEATKDLFERPRPGDVDRAFEAVKNSIASGSSVDARAKQLVFQATRYDVESLRYMDKIAGLGPLSIVSDRVFKLYSDTNAIVIQVKEKRKLLANKPDFNHIQQEENKSKSKD